MFPQRVTSRPDSRSQATRLGRKGRGGYAGAQPATQPGVQNPAESSSWLTKATGIGALLALSVAGMLAIFAVSYLLPDVGAKSYWFMSRSSGLVAYVLLTLGVLWGLVQSGALFRAHVSPLVALGMHSFLSWLGLGLAALHGIVLIGDGYINIDLARVFTPFLSEYRSIPVGLGIIGFYLMLLLTLSFYARNQLGQRTFRALHYSSFAVFLMVTAHGIFAGTDSALLWWLYAGSLILVAALTTLRVSSTRRARQLAVQKRQSRGEIPTQVAPAQRTTRRTH